MIEVEGNTRRETVGDPSTGDVKSDVADRTVGAVGAEVDVEVETVDGGKAKNGIDRDIGTEGEREDDGVVSVADGVRGKVPNDGSQTSVCAEVKGGTVGNSAE